MTGGAGFIGSAVVAALVARGHDVRVLDAGSPKAHRDGPPGQVHGVPVTLGDVRDRQAVATALGGVDAVCHQAAMVGLGVTLDDLPDYASCNDVGTAVLLAEMARAGVARLVLAGSMVVYGEGRYECPEHGRVAAPPRSVEALQRRQFEPECGRCGRPLSPGLVPEDTVPDPRNGYAVTKLAQELLARVWQRETGGALTVLRYHNVYGPGLPRDTPYAGVAAIFRSALERGQAPTVYEDGGQRRDFVHVDDVAVANVQALEAQLDGGATPPGRAAVFNVGSGRPRTVLDLATALATALGGPQPVVSGQFRLGDVRHITADTALIRRELDWQPRVEFETGIRQLATAPLRS